MYACVDCVLPPPQPPAIESITFFSFSICRRVLNELRCSSKQPNSVTRAIRRRNVDARVRARECVCGCALCAILIHQPKMKCATHIIPIRMIEIVPRTITNGGNGMKRAARELFKFTWWIKFSSKSISASLSISISSLFVCSTTYSLTQPSTRSQCILESEHFPFGMRILDRADGMSMMCRSYLLCPIHCTRIQSFFSEM